MSLFFFLCFAFWRNSEAKKTDETTQKVLARAAIKYRYTNETVSSDGKIAPTNEKNEYRFSLIILIAYLHVYPKLKWKTLLLLYVFELWFNWARRLSHRLFDCCCRCSNFSPSLSLSLAVRVNCSSGNVWNWNDKWKRPRKKKQIDKKQQHQREAFILSLSARTHTEFNLLRAWNW